MELTGPEMVAIVPHCATCHLLPPEKHKFCGGEGAATGCKIVETLAANQEEVAKIDPRHPHYRTHCTVLGHRLAGVENVAVRRPKEMEKLYAPPEGIGTSVRSAQPAEVKDVSAPQLMDAAAKAVAEPAAAHKVSGAKPEGIAAPRPTTVAVVRPHMQQRPEAVVADLPQGGGIAQGAGRGAAGPSGEGRARGTVAPIGRPAEALPGGDRGMGILPGPHQEAPAKWLIEFLPNKVEGKPAFSIVPQLAGAQCDSPVLLCKFSVKLW